MDMGESLITQDWKILVMMQNMKQYKLSKILKLTLLQSKKYKGRILFANLSKRVNIL